MHTGRSLTVCCSLLPGGVSAWSRGCPPGLGGVCLVWGGSALGGCLPGPGRGVCLVPGGCLPGLGGVCLVQGGVCLVQGGLPGLGGVSSQGGVCSRGVWSWMGVSAPRILDTRLWKYYLGPTSLRPVTRMHSSRMRTARSLNASRSIRRGACIPGGVHAIHAPPPGRDRHLWKHNLRKIWILEWKLN